MPETNTEELVRLHYGVIAPLLMSNGIGDGKTTACFMAQAATIDALRKGQALETPTDEMECACPLLRRMAIRANDTSWWENDEERTEHLRPLIPLLLDSRVSKEVGWKRAFHIADNIVRVLTPERLEFIASRSKNEKLKEENARNAKALRELPAIIDLETCKAAREVCRKFRDDATAYAYAYAYANADANADAYAYANADADAYAYAYAYANADAEQRLKYRDMFLTLFRAVAAITQ